jgi:Flp pilus assembly protein TadB
MGVTEWILIFCLSGFLSLLGMMYYQPKAEQVFKRIEALEIFSKGTDEEKERLLPLHKRLYKDIEDRLSQFIDRKMRKGSFGPLKQRLVQANDYITSPTQHWAKKIIFACVATLAGIILAKGLMVIVVLGSLGFYYPDHKLKEKIAKRQMRIKTEIPDYLDLLASVAPAAKHLEDAIRKVCDRTEGEISDEFRRALEEMNTGRRRRDALNSLSMRCGIAEIKTLVAQINQSEVFGTDVADTLEAQANKIRRLKKLVAEIKARKAAVMLIMPSFFLLITVLIMIAGPFVIQLMAGLKAV